MTGKEPPSSTSSLNSRGSSSTILAYDHSSSLASSGYVRNICSSREGSNCSPGGKTDAVDVNIPGSDNGGLSSCYEGNRSGSRMSKSSGKNEAKTRLSGTPPGPPGGTPPAKRRFVPNRESPTWKSIQKKQKESPKGYFVAGGNVNDDIASNDESLPAGEQLSANRGAGKCQINELIYANSEDRPKEKFSPVSAVSQMPTLSTDTDVIVAPSVGGNFVLKRQQERQSKQRYEQEHRGKNQRPMHPLIEKSAPDQHPLDIREVPLGRAAFQVNATGIGDSGIEKPCTDDVSVTLVRKAVNIAQCLSSDSGNTSGSSTLNFALERLPEEDEEEEEDDGYDDDKEEEEDDGYDDDKEEEEEKAGEGNREGMEEEEEAASAKYRGEDNILVARGELRNDMPKTAVASSLESFVERRKHQHQKQLHEHSQRRGAAVSANTLVSAVSGNLACPSSDSTSSSLIYSLGDTVKSSSPNNGSEILILKPSDYPIPKGTSMMHPQDNDLKGHAGNNPLKEHNKPIDEKGDEEDEDCCSEDEENAASLVASTLAECRMLLEISPPPTPVSDRYRKRPNENPNVGSVDHRHDLQSQELPRTMQLQLSPGENFEKALQQQTQAIQPHQTQDHAPPKKHHPESNNGNNYAGDNSLACSTASTSISSITNFLTCPACSNKFSDGSPSVLSRVPLHSFACDHIVCSACVFANKESNYSQAVESTPTLCPECGVPGAFDTNRPVVSRGYLGLMRRLAQDCKKIHMKHLQVQPGMVPSQICVPSPTSKKCPHSSPASAAKDLHKEKISVFLDSNAPASSSANCTAQACASLKDVADNEHIDHDQGDGGYSNHYNEEKAKEKTTYLVEPTTPVSRAEYRFLRRKEKLAHSLEKINRIIERSKAAKDEVRDIHLYKKALDEEEISVTDGGIYVDELNIQGKSNEKGDVGIERDKSCGNTPKKDLKGGYDDTVGHNGDRAHDAMEEADDDTSSRKTTANTHSRLKLELRVETGENLLETTQDTVTEKIQEAGNSDSIKKSQPLVVACLPMADPIEVPVPFDEQWKGRHDAFPKPSGDSIFDIFRVNNCQEMGNEKALPLIDAVAQSISNDSSLLSGSGEDTLLLLSDNCTKAISSTMDSRPLRKMRDLTINIKGLASEGQQWMAPSNSGRQEHSPQNQHQQYTCPQFLPSLNYSNLNSFDEYDDEKSPRSPMWSYGGGSSTVTPGSAKGMLLSTTTSSHKKRMGRAMRRSGGDRRNFRGDVHPKVLKKLLTQSFDETFCRMDSGNSICGGHIGLLNSPQHRQSRLDHLQEEQPGLKRENGTHNAFMQQECQGPSYDFSMHSCSMSQSSCNDGKLDLKGHERVAGSSLGGALVTHKPRSSRFHKKILNLRRNMWRITSKS